MYPTKIQFLLVENYKNSTKHKCNHHKQPSTYYESATICS